MERLLIAKQKLRRCNCKKYKNPLRSRYDFWRKDIEKQRYKFDYGVYKSRSTSFQIDDESETQ